MGMNESGLGSRISQKRGEMWDIGGICWSKSMVLQSNDGAGNWPRDFVTT